MDAPTGADGCLREVSGRAPFEIKLGDGRRSVSRHARAFPARLDEFSGVVAFVTEVSSQAGFDREAVLKLTLILEELFTNTVTHGRGDGTPVTLELDVAPGRIWVMYEDSGPRFEPFADATSEGQENRPPGGLGLLLVNRLGRDVQYSHSGGRNRFSLVVEITR